MKGSIAVPIAGHGPNIGHGFVKYILIDEHGVEHEPVIFPALVARASRAVAGGLAQATSVEFGGKHWWVGDDALLSPTPITILVQDRLSDATFIPTLVRGAMNRLEALNGSTNGTCVTGLPATWALDTEKAQQLGERLRSVSPIYRWIRVIPEPLGLIYSLLLDNHGHLVGDPVLTSGKVAIIDIGHHTVDIAVIQRMVPVPAALDTYQLGTARPLQQIRAQLARVFECDLTLFETDQAVRREGLNVAGRFQPLPAAWDRPLREYGDLIATRLVEAWGRGSQFDTILIGGGGAELPPLVAAIQQRFAHAQLVEQPQTAVARGYARLARRLGEAKLQETTGGSHGR
jgi:hypothetical protein